MQSLFSGQPGSDDARLQAALEDIRRAMLECLGEAAALAYPVVRLRVTYANDLQDLWYLRGDVMEAVASVDGEALARRKLTQVSDMFRGHLPKGLVSRPSPLEN